MHAASFTSEDFQASYREEPLPFCKDCHAPRARAAAGSSDAQVRESLGVDCESCHPSATAHADARASGSTVRAETVPCAGCHEFTSPGSRTFLQSTETEHAASAYRDVPCVACHMKALQTGESDHGFLVSRAPAFLRAALVLDGVVVEGDTVSFSLRATNVGHAFPTGDIFRQLLVRATLEGADGRILVAQDFALHRDWDAHRHAYRAVQGSEEADTRLGAIPRVLRVPFVAGATRLVVQVDYQRGFEARGRALALFSSTPIAEASFALPR